jgi:hypothetical protein
MSLLTACSSPSARERCEDDREHVEDCNRVYDTDVCADKSGRCATACYGRASCKELDATDNDDWPAWLDQCLYKCAESAQCSDGRAIQERWICDGEEDCSDGSDEKGCVYLTCDDHMVVNREARCDGYADCYDESDEADCP